MKLLVSVKSGAEALQAAAAGADVIDFKDPAHGALGAWALGDVVPALQRLRAAHPGLLVSATIGDQPLQQPAVVLPRVREMAATGVGVVKVGVLPGPTAGPLLAALAGLAGAGVPVVPLFLADAGVPHAEVALALAHAGAFPVLMLDTEHKGQGSLLQRLPAAALQGFVAAVQASGRQAGLAGALRAADLPALRALGPDIAGFRSAVCDGPRAGALVPARVAALREQMA